MAFDDPIPTPTDASPALVATLVKRIDERTEFGHLLDLSDLLAAAWPSGRAMNQ